MSKIRIKFLTHGENLYKIKKQTSGSAGFDLMAAIKEDIIIEASHSSLIPCGFALALPPNFEAQVRPRSGLALKNLITVLNSPGTIDSDYRGEVCVILINHSKKSFKVTSQMRIAQIIFKTLPNIEVVEVDNLDDTERGQGGFGSTGNN